MTCEQFQDRLTAFSLGELEPHEAVAAREHVARCSGCASRALLDRQLTSLVRSTAVPTPDTVRVRIMSALRDEARGHGQRNHRRHWLSLGAAAGLAAAMLAAALLLGPAAETPNLTSFGYRVQGAGGRMLAGHLAAVTEYRDMAGHRMTLIRWKGDLPEMASARGPTSDPGVDAARWGSIGSIWWSSHGIVYCLIGGVQQQLLYRVTEHLQSGAG